MLRTYLTGMLRTKLLQTKYHGDDNVSVLHSAAAQKEEPQGIIPLLQHQTLQDSTVEYPRTRSNLEFPSSSSDSLSRSFIQLGWIGGSILSWLRFPDKSNYFAYKFLI